MAKKISVSFKETTKEMQLYTTVFAIEDRSNWIKDLIVKALSEENKNKEVRS